jgi:hypothetical protein
MRYFSGYSVESTRLGVMFSLLLFDIRRMLARRQDYIRAVTTDGHFVEIHGSKPGGEETVQRVDVRKGVTYSGHLWAKRATSPWMCFGMR